MHDGVEGAAYGIFRGSSMQAIAMCAAERYNLSFYHTVKKQVLAQYSPSCMVQKKKMSFLCKVLAAAHVHPGWS